MTETPEPETRRNFGARFLRAGYPYFLLSPSLLVLLLVGVYPFVFMIVLSFRKLDFRRLGTAGDFIGLENYRSLFDEPVFFSSLKTTAFIAFTSVPLELVLGFAMAYLFNRNFPLKRLAVTITIIPTVLAPIAIAVMWKILLATPWGFLMYNVFYRLGMFEDVSIFGSPGWALAAIIAIDVWEWTPFMFLVFLAGLGGLPQRPSEAAARAIREPRVEHRCRASSGRGPLGALRRHAHDPIAQLREGRARRACGLGKKAVGCHPRQRVRLQTPRLTLLIDDKIHPREIPEP